MLLVQDIVVVILLAVLAAGRPDDLAEIATTLAVVLVLSALITVAAIGASRYVLPHIFRRIADNTEVFFLIALSWAFLFVFVSDEINLFLAPFGIEAYLSIEMGAFLAGLAIAQLPYSKELRDRVNPLTDLFVMIFFVTVALTLERSELLFYWQEALIAAVVLMPVKFIIFFWLINWQRFSPETTFLGSINMIQVSEFGIIVGVAAQQGGFIGTEVLGFLTLIALITMGVSVYFIEFNHRLYERFDPVVSRWAIDEEFQESKKAYRDHAVIIGLDEVSHTALPILTEQYADILIVDRTVDHIEQLEAAGYDTLYGDVQNASIRKGAAIKTADFVLSSSEQTDVNKAVLREADDDATVFIEAKRIDDARELYDAGATSVLMGTHFASSRLVQYLQAYLEDRTEFQDIIKSDKELIEQKIDYPTAIIEGDLDE